MNEIYHRVVEDEGFSEDQQAVLTKDGKIPMIQYRMHWARTNLKGVGAVENSARGVWAITEKGAALPPEELKDQVKMWLGDVKLSASPERARDLQSRPTRTDLVKTIQQRS